MDFSHNPESRVYSEWRVQDGSDIGCGAVTDEKCDHVVYADEAGLVTCLRMNNGRKEWSVQLPGKIFSTPAIQDNKVVVGCCDGGVYCLNLKNGKQIWSVMCGKSVLGSPTIFDNNVFIGSSDGIFRAMRLKDGKSVWSYGDIKGFVECKPFVDRQQVVFGSWGNTLYSLSPSRGTLQWKWETQGSRMYSPAAVWPVKSDGKIFIVTPERKFYAIDARTGRTSFEGEGGRESIGLSADGKEFYVKTMNDGLMVAHVESLVQDLNLPYRIVRLCGGDLSFTSAITYDFEVWSAAQKRWLEVSSVSNFESYQANRLKLRYKDADGKIQLAHTLNGSSLALPRIVAAMLENNQYDGGIMIPEMLRPYTGFDRIDSRNGRQL